MFFFTFPDEDGSEGYLVDFQKKAVDRIVEERRGSKDKVTPVDNEDDINLDPIPEPDGPEEEW